MKNMLDEPNRNLKHSHLIKIDYPDTKPQIKIVSGKEMIFCLNRKRWVILTPEEWVRQNFLLYLIEVLHFPLSLIAVEKQLILNDMKKRFDIVVFDRNAKPFMIVECKEMNVPLTENTLQQVLRYNINIQAKLVVVSNGNSCAAFEKLEGSFLPLEEMPKYNKTENY